MRDAHYSLRIKTRAKLVQIGGIHFGESCAILWLRRLLWLAPIQPSGDNRRRIFLPSAGLEGLRVNRVPQSDQIFPTPADILAVPDRARRVVGRVEFIHREDVWHTRAVRATE